MVDVEGKASSSSWEEEDGPSATARTDVKNIWSPLVLPATKKDGAMELKEYLDFDVVLHFRRRKDPAP
ncbi:hypothetical protein PRIPAC_73018 [Pristionchus pacificus]|nr:hypothetical protein PRIPAC_73018 [Pristionchus pacificus]|eukprot:PDM64844.1 hypothetical protein PRIPAC_53100 [Pristionchus pacificus]